MIVELITEEDVKGKVVILDFWTYGCVNCVHVIPDLHRLEQDFGDKLAVISVHSPKFPNEKDIDNLRNIVARYGIKHAVANDIGFKLWKKYQVRAWPTFVVIDPEGEFVGKLSGEGRYQALKDATELLLQKHAGSINASPLPLDLTQPDTGILNYPGKVSASEQGIAIADTGHHRIILTDEQGKIKQIYGSGNARLEDGKADKASFQYPQGLVFKGNSLYVADTGNHAIRKIDLTTHEVTTLAGTGELGRTRQTAGDPTRISLRSPWGLAEKNDILYIAMAGTHQIWQLDLKQQKLGVFAGSGWEDITDGSLQKAAFSQPSGLSFIDNKLYVADTEDSAIREIDLSKRKVNTLVGKGLFDFGDKDGSFHRAVLQHPQGISAISANELILADTYNHKLKLVNLKNKKVSSIKLKGLKEPGGVSYWNNKLYIADTNNHQIQIWDLASQSASQLKLR